MRYSALVRDRRSGEVRATCGDLSPSGVLFLYTLGGWSCDCNRELDYLRAGGEGLEHADPGNTCPGSVRFDLVRLQLEDGRWIQDGDLDWRSPPEVLS